ncbi:LysR family transcriptional regulator ArgP [Luethyella okanaganae]|uniref:LysR family transcriptional regulator ArgP n=1 Tax=Luethyella okanaganae TaxID=69372 RepID=A0ABW1VBQ0_9MICO
MEIPLDLARTVSAVVSAGTFDAAARALNVTPSAVSQRIKTLEQLLGRVLLVRSKPVVATDAGQAVVRLARQLELLEHDVLAEIGLHGGGTPTAVPLAINADSLGAWMLKALARIAERHPVTFEVHREDQEHTIALLETGLVMAAVTSCAEAVQGCVSRHLGDMRYRAVATPAFVARWMPAGADRRSLSIAPLVDFDRQDDLQTRFLRAHGVEVAAPPRHYIPASNEFAEAVASGLGWGLLPELQSRGLIAGGNLVELAPNEPADVPLYWQQWNLRSPMLTAIADEVFAEARAVLRADARPVEEA